MKCLSEETQCLDDIVPAIRVIHIDILNYVLRQPKQMDQMTTVYEHDRPSVEQTFASVAEDVSKSVKS